MAQNLKLDPAKRDYVTVNGSPVPSDRIEEKTYYALLIPETKWLYVEPGQGSLIWTLEGKKQAPSTEQQLSAFAQDAIKRQLIANGQATSSEVTNIEQTRGGTSNLIRVVQSQTDLSDQLNFVPV